MTVELKNIVSADVFVAFNYLSHVRERLSRIVVIGEELFDPELTPNEELVLDLALDEIGDFIAGRPGAVADARSQAEALPVSEPRTQNLEPS